jgi:hypothetical protein
MSDKPSDLTKIGNRFQPALNVCGGAAAAIAVQPLILLAKLAPELSASLTGTSGLSLMLVASLAAGALAVLLLGLPTFLLLRKLRRDGWASLAIAGTLLGALPCAVFWPTSSVGVSAGQTWHGTYVETYVDGTPTAYAWLMYGEGMLWFAAHGLIGSLTFYAVWRWLSHRSA